MTSYTGKIIFISQFIQLINKNLISLNQKLILTTQKQNIILCRASIYNLHSNKIIKIFMSRRRQFSAERNLISQGNLSQSGNSIRSSGSNKNNIQKYSIGTPQPTKKISFSQKSNHSSRSEYICVGCYNDKLSSDKKNQAKKSALEQKAKQRYNNQVRMKEDAELYLRNSRLLKESIEMNKYNKTLIEEKHHSKQKQQNYKLKQSQQQKLDYEQYKKGMDIKLKEKQKQKYKFRNQIKMQIQEKFQKSETKKQTDANNYQQILVGKPQVQYLNEKFDRQQRYRQDLLKQIHEKQKNHQRQNQQKNNNVNLGIGITQAAYQRQIQRHKQIQQRKQKLLQEAANRKKILQSQEQFLKKRNEKIHQQQVELENQRQKMQRQGQIQKQRQIDAYLDDLKKQIQSQKKQKLKDFKNSHQLTKNSIDFPEKQIIRKQCKSCQKKFSKTFLTKVK